MAMVGARLLALVLADISLVYVTRSGIWNLCPSLYVVNMYTFAFI